MQKSHWNVATQLSSSPLGGILMIKIQVSENIFKEDSTFHKIFAEVMGFPDFYGSNWDAWIDCMSYINVPDAQMSKIVVSNEELLEIEILIDDGNEYFKSQTWGYFNSCVAVVNKRLANSGSMTRLVITEKVKPPNQSLKLTWQPPALQVCKCGVGKIQFTLRESILN